MIVCWCSSCTYPCGRKFLTSEEYRRFTKERYVAKNPKGKVLSSIDYEKKSEGKKAE